MLFSGIAFVRGVGFFDGAFARGGVFRECFERFFRERRRFKRFLGARFVFAGRVLFLTGDAGLFRGTDLRETTLRRAAGRRRRAGRGEAGVRVDLRLEGGIVRSFACAKTNEEGRTNSRLSRKTANRRPEQKMFELADKSIKPLRLF